MLYKFKSKSTGDVIMLQPNGQRVLEIIGKDSQSASAAQGIILPGQMLDAIAALEAAILKEEAEHKAAAASAQEKNETPPRPEAISLRQRATPFIDMLRRCEKDGTEIVWGV
jgi:regulator of protease activity HflC (stomatin/prohibitin superfamily)